MAERRKNKDSGPKHFLGAVVLEQVATFGNQVPGHIIIDGQQRLTTFQILLAALRDVASTLGVTRYADEVERYILNTGIMENEDEERFKVWPSRPDQPAFSKVTTARSLKDVESDPSHGPSLLTQAYRFFHKLIHSWVVTDGGQGETEHVEILYQVLRDDLEVVSIELEGDDDPQVIFETLNARGQPLLPSDLLRNFIFWRATRKGENKDKLYDQYWLPFDQKFWKIEERLGRLKRPRIDIFLQHFLESQKGEEINVVRLFYEYKTWIAGTNPFESVESELKALQRYSEIFRQLIEADSETKPYGLFFWRIKEIEVGTIFPLLLFLLTHPEGKSAEIGGMLIDLESYLFRRLICGLTPKNYNRIFLQVIRELRDTGLSRENLQQSLLKMRGDAGLWPDDRRFNERWMNRQVYAEIKPPRRLTVILRAIEDALHAEKNEDISIKSPLTVEHIMPQDWVKSWPLSDGAFAKDWLARMLGHENNPEADERDALKHTFGNLTLLTQPLNSAVSNASYDVKRPEICKQSALALNRYFQNVEVWNAEQIRFRAQKLLEVAKRIWPYPGDV